MSALCALPNASLFARTSRECAGSGAAPSHAVRRSLARNRIAATSRPQVQQAPGRATGAVRVEPARRGHWISHPPAPVPPEGW
jgi:hypothetical protein